jgi:lysophospholipase L1-like esterase
MDRVGIDLARRHGALHLPLGGALLEPGDAFAADGFHPSARAHAWLADSVVMLLEEHARGGTDAVR